MTVGGAIRAQGARHPRSSEQHLRRIHRVPLLTSSINHPSNLPSASPQQRLWSLKSSSNIRRFTPKSISIRSCHKVCRPTPSEREPSLFTSRNDSNTFSEQGTGKNSLRNLFEKFQQSIAANRHQTQCSRNSLNSSSPRPHSSWIQHFVSIQNRCSEKPQLGSCNLGLAYTSSWAMMRRWVSRKTVWQVPTYLSFPISWWRRWIFWWTLWTLLTRLSPFWISAKKLEKNWSTRTRMTSRRYRQ